MKALLRYRCGQRGNGCLLGYVVVVDGEPRFAKPDQTVQPLPDTRGPVEGETLIHVRCDHLDTSLHPSVVRHEMTRGRFPRDVLVQLAV